MQALYHDNIVEFSFRECGLFIDNILFEEGLSNEWKDGIRESWIQDGSLNVLAFYHPICPHSIKNLKNLKHYTGKALTDSMKYLEFLETIDLSCNFLREISDFWDELKYLKRINLNDNFLDRIPDSLFKVAQRPIFIEKYVEEGVNPEDAPILALFEMLCGHKLEKADKLNSFHNCEFSINDEGHVVGIGISDPENYCIGIIPRQIESLKFLEELALFSHRIRVIPDIITNLTNLKVLNLGDNFIREVPENFGNLKNLEELSLYENLLKNIPNSICSLKNLQKLDLSNNIIDTFPECICHLENLKQLELENCKIKNIPDSITYMNSLEKLNLSKNKVSALHQIITKLKNQGLDVQI